MIEVEEAIQLCISKTSLGKSKKIELQEVDGGFISENIYSEINLPSFRNSAMDGWAILYSDYENKKREFKIVGEIQAGDTNNYSLNTGETYRIFTGAPTPLNCDLVIMQENVLVKSKYIIIKEKNSKQNQNIRQIGEQVRKEDLALNMGCELSPASIGYLASLGQSKIKTILAPKITVVSTGNELVEQNHKLKFGQIYESNSYGIVSQLKKWGISQISNSKLKDNFSDTLNRIKELIKTQDYLILTGGISVGDYDFVGKALKELGVEQVFYKVKQKPGKPIFFGRKNNCHIFALPGNPAAALSCLHIYVKTSIQKFRGDLNASPLFISMKAENSFVKKGNRAQFLKAKLTGTSVHILEGQSSNMMQTFAIANVLVYLKKEEMGIEKGGLVRGVLV